MGTCAVVGDGGCQGADLEGDGCSSTCEVEAPYECVGGGLFTVDVCTKCGDGIRPPLSLEQCDDGNQRGADGCSPFCTIEPGFVCIGGGANSSDRCEVCGDGKRVSPGICDDGNNVSVRL